MADDLICPKCGKIDTSRDDLHLKTSAVYTSGQATGTYTDWEGYRSYDNIQSQLSRRLAPPTIPSQPFFSSPTGHGCRMTSGWILAAFCLILFVGMDPNAPLWGRLIFLGLAILIALFTTNVIPKQDASKLAQWKPKAERAEKALSLWNRLYYCRRHDIVFDTDSSFNLPSDQLQSYWRESAK